MLLHRVIGQKMAHRKNKIFPKVPASRPRACAVWCREGAQGDFRGPQELGLGGARGRMGVLLQ